MEDYEKELLLRDLGTRFVGGVYCQVDGVEEPVKLLSIHADHVDGILIQFDKKDKDGHILEVYVSEVKPDLRPMSSMTDEERNIYKSFFSIGEYSCGGSLYGKEYEYIDSDSDDIVQCISLIDWLNEHHFDYRGLIEKGLALEATENMYKDN